MKIYDVRMSFINDDIDAVALQSVEMINMGANGWIAFKYPATGTFKIFNHAIVAEVTLYNEREVEDA